MKKILGIIMITILCITLVGCDNNMEVKMDYTKPVVVER